MSSKRRAEKNVEFGAVQKCAKLVELEKCLQMLPNAYLFAKIGFDTAENEPAKKICKICEIFNIIFAEFCYFG